MATETVTVVPGSASPAASSLTYPSSPLNPGDPTNSNSGSDCIVGRSCYVDLVIRDSHNQAISTVPITDVRMACTVVVDGPAYYRLTSDQGQIVIVATTINSEYGYRANFMSAMAGDVNCTVWVEDVLFANSVNSMLPGPVSAGETDVYGSGLRYVQAGQTATFYVEPKDSYGNLVALSSTTAVATQLTSLNLFISVKLRPTGLFGAPKALSTVSDVTLTAGTNIVIDSTRITVTYQVATTGIVEVCISTQAVCTSASAIPSALSPYMVPVTAAAPAASALVVSGPGLLAGVAGSYSWFDVFLRDAGNNPVALRSYPLYGALTASGTALPINSTLNPSTGSIRFNFTTPAAGTYALTVYLGMQAVTLPAGSATFTSQSSAGSFAASKSYLDGPGLEVIQVGAGTPIFYYALDSNGAPFEGSCSPTVSLAPCGSDSTCASPGTAVALSSHVYLGQGIYVFNTSTVTTSGYYKLTSDAGVTYNVAGSGSAALPLTVRVVAGAINATNTLLEPRACPLVLSPCPLLLELPHWMGC